MGIEHIYFDIGNVLLAFDWGKAAKAIGDRSAIASDQILNRLSESRIDEYERGLLTTEQFFSDLQAKLRYQGELDELVLAASDIFFPLESNLELARRLRERYRLGIISNINAAHVQFLEEKYDFFSLFETRVYSCEVGSRKPESRIFEHALRALGASPPSALFVDDLEQNVSAARGLGWSAIRALPGTDLQGAMQRLGVATAAP